MLKLAGRDFTCGCARFFDHDLNNPEPTAKIFLADEGRGEALEIQGTFFVSEHWPPGKCFLGYSGLLERIRFALDPQENLFYFGPSGEPGS